MSTAPGLYHKALAYLEARSRLRIVRPDEPSEADDEGISPEERERILAQIEETVAASRTPIGRATFRFKPRKRGGVLPLLVWIGAITVTAVGVTLAVEMSREREATAATPVSLTTAEGKLLETFRQESREELEGKDREIASIREKLAGIDRERARLAAETQARIDARARELEAGLAATLEEQRRALAARGLSEAETARRLAELEASSRAALDGQLAEFRAEADAERSRQEQAIEALRAEYQQGLLQAQSARARLQEDAARRQAELEAGYRQKQLALEQDKATALARLGELEGQRERERLVLDQLLGFYQRVRDEISAGQAAAASRELARLRSYLDDPAVAGLPGIERRRPVELFLVASLEEVVRARGSAPEENATVQSLVASAGLVTAVAELVAQGDALYGQRDYAQAREVYLSAMAKIPAVETGYERLEAIEDQYASRGKLEVAAAFADGGAAYRAGDYPRALDRYGRGLELLQGERGTVDTLIAQLQQVGAIRERAAAAQRIAELEAALAAAPARGAGLEDELAASEAARAELARELAAATERAEALAGELAAASRRAEELSTELAAARDRTAGTLAELSALRQRAAQAAAGAPAAAASREELLALLNTKLLVQKVLLSEAVVANYPDLARGLDRYLEALVAESRGDAQIEALRDLDEALGRLAARQGAAVSDALLARYAPSGQQELLLDILDKLRALVE